VKTGIHPDYHHNVIVRCACGNEFVTGSVIPGPIRVEICAACHPFFTGEQKFVDTEGRVDRFRRRKEDAQKKRAEEKLRKERKVAKTNKGADQPKTLREMLEQTRN